VASKEFEMNKLGAAVMTSDITLTNPGTHKNFRKPTSAKATVSLWQHK